jgi:hypothetical protein
MVSSFDHSPMFKHLSDWDPDIHCLTSLEAASVVGGNYTLKRMLHSFVTNNQTLKIQKTFIKIRNFFLQIFTNTLYFT